jgi:hypothetical protein
MPESIRPHGFPRGFPQSATIKTLKSELMLSQKSINVDG